MIDMEHIYPTAVDLAETIKVAMRAAHISQRELAEQSGVALTTLGRRLNGSPIEYDELTAVAKALGRSASSLIAETEARVRAERCGSSNGSAA